MVLDTVGGGLAPTLWTLRDMRVLAAEVVC